jgi:peroxiredoxin
MDSSMTANKTNKRVLSTLSVLGVLLLLMTNILLMQQNESLKSSVNKSDRALEVKIGKELPPLEGIDTNGNKLTVSYGQDARKTVLFVFSPRCGACKSNMPNWQTLIKGLDQQAYRLMAVSLQPEGVKEYTKEWGLDKIPTLAEIDSKHKVTYSLALTPQMILIDADGKVERVWTGLLKEEELQDIERTLNAKLSQASAFLLNSLSHALRQ